MREGPDIAHIASLVGDPARANMLTALVGGTALTASELALEAGVMLPTASSHLAKLIGGGLLKLTVQGRHRYYRAGRAAHRGDAGIDHGRGGDGRAAARAPRAARQADARGARLLRPSRRRSRRCDARRIAGAWRARARRRGDPPRATRRSVLRVARDRHVGAVEASDGRSAAPASTGACGARTCRARWAPRSSTRRLPKDGRAARAAAAW